MRKAILLLIGLMFCFVSVASAWQGELPYVIQDAAPAVTDSDYPAPFLWYDQVGYAFYFLGDNTSGAAVWQEMVASGTSPSFVTVDLTGVTDGNIPYMQAAAAGFGDSPISYDGTKIDITTPTDSTISTTTAGGESGHYASITHITNALTGELIGMRGNARVDTIDSSSGTVMGGKFQSGNMGTGTDLATATGVYVDVVNKIPSGATTWTNARGFEASMDLDQGSAGNVNTITNAYMFYGVYNLPTVDTYATVTNGYGVFVRNEAVGGTGQMLDAAFYADDKSHSGGIYGWDFGIDFSGVGANSGAFGTADIRGVNSETISNNTNGTWDFDAANLVTTGTFGAGVTTVTSLTSSATPTPGITLIDSDTTDEDDSAIIYANATDTATTTEDIDIYIRQQIAGTMTTTILADADGDLELGSATQNTNIKGDLEVTGAQFGNITAVAAATYDLLVTDYILSCTYTGTGAITSLTLPTAQVTAGRIIHIKDTGGGASTYNITVDTEGAETIDGAATAVITSNYSSISLFCDGTNWFIY